jgi:hypothetical protein
MAESAIRIISQWIGFYKGNNEVTNIASGQMSNFGTNALPPLFPPKKRMQLVFFSTSRKSDTQHEVDHRGETNLA